MHISNWSACRSGDAMTIRGTADIDGSRLVIRAKKIEQRGDRVIAITADGEEHVLRVGNEH